MESLKDIWNSFTTLYKDKVRFYTLKGVEKSSLLLGLLSTIAIISVIFLMVLIFGSFALANFLNTKLDSGFLGYLIVAGIYLITVFILFFLMIRRNAPLLTGFFIRFLISLFNISDDEDQQPEKPQSRNGTH